MKILYIEPYYADSHKRWIEAYIKHSKHDIDILKLPGNKWKWRMHGGAITLAEQFINNKLNYDLILCSDFLNLPVFKSIAQSSIKNTPVAMYFHENQITYPWPEHDPDKALNRDLHYHYINQTSAMVSDWNFFNSEYNLDSFLIGLDEYLRKMPDHQNISSVEKIRKKSSILHIGCELSKFNQHKVENNNKTPIILWNHRWEYDKNPELFFQSLFKIKEMGIDFNLVVLGQKFSSTPRIFDSAFKKLKNNILHYGYCDSFDEYAKWLWKADIIPVTSNQDFFGISIVEAVYCNTSPILPSRLSYKELFNEGGNTKIFYSKDEELVNKIIKALKDENKLENYSSLTTYYDWKNIVSKYDQDFESITKI